MRPWLITGTDTGVGKTHVTRVLILALRARGLKPTVIKPVETGCDDLERPEDGSRLAIASGMDVNVVCPVRLRLPAAPTTAARAEGRTLSTERVLETIDVARRQGAPLLIEGAGGALVPITEELCFADLARRLNARVLIVARHRLGTLNHTRLTVEALKARETNEISVVFNETATADVAEIDHAGELRRVIDGVQFFGPLPWCTDDRTSVSAIEATGLVDAILNKG